MRRTHLIRRAFCEWPTRSGAFIALLLWYFPAFAVDPPPSTRYQIEQPSQPLSDLLRSIARQTGISVLFDPVAVNGRMSRPVSGQLSVSDAIARALDGSGLTVEVMKDGSIVVKTRAAAAAGTQVRTRGAQPFAPLASGDVTSDSAPVLLAQASSTGQEPSAASSPAEAASSADGQKIEITGSRIKRIAAEGPVPVNTYTSEEISKSGQPSLERFLLSLNEVSMSAGQGGSSPVLGQGTVQLRGLPLGSTLVLINGRRVQAVGSSSANFFNLNLIPMAAVERIEVVPVGSSAVYGGDALAGVVNIILKKSIDGNSLTARLATGKGASDGSLSLATGGADDHGSYLLLGSISKATPLNMTERAFFSDADYRRFGGPDARTRSCTPGTVTSNTAANLPGLNSTLAGIPSLPDGQPLSIASFVASAGQANLCNPRATGRGLALIHGGESFGIHAAGDRRITANWSVFGELTYADDHLRADEIGVTLSNVLVPATNPYNPFGVPVRVTTTLGPENGVQSFIRDTKFTRILAGLRGDLGGGWDAELTGSTTRDHSNRLATRNTVDAAARDAALAATTTAAAINPFTAGRAASDDVLSRIWADSEREGRGRKDQLSAFVRGPLVELSAGAVEAIVGAEIARDEFATVITGAGALSKSDTRRTSAGYAELRVPLLRSDPAVGRPWSLAAVTVAGRRDKYSDFGSAGTYQAGLEMRPARTVLLRASLATSFKPPTLSQTNVDDRSVPAGDIGLVDPARNNEPIVSGDLLRTGNSALGPERGRAHAWGAVWEPEGGLGTRLGFTAWRVQIDGLIGVLDPQTLLRNEAMFPGFVTRGPSVAGLPGPVTRIINTEVNFGGVDTAGVDVDAAYSLQFAGGRWSLGAGATRLSQYRVELRPNTVADDRLGRRFADYWAPQWKGRLSVGLDQGPWRIGFTSRYLGAYKDAGTSTRRLGDFWNHDLAGSVDLKKLGVNLGGVKGAALSVAIVNLTDREPQFVATAPYYDVTQADWRGRYASVRLSIDW
jgi:iron complex outermembrane recepter protein